MTDPEPTDVPAAKRRVVIRPRLHRALEALAEKNDTDLHEEANRAIRELLEREGLWPPAPDNRDDPPTG